MNEQPVGVRCIDCGFFTDGDKLPVFLDVHGPGFNAFDIGTDDLFWSHRADLVPAAPNCFRGAAALQAEVEEYCRLTGVDRDDSEGEVVNVISHLRTCTTFMKREGRLTAREHVDLLREREREAREVSWHDEAQRSHDVLADREAYWRKRDFWTRVSEIVLAAVVGAAVIVQVIFEVLNYRKDDADGSALISTPTPTATEPTTPQPPSPTAANPP